MTCGLCSVNNLMGERFFNMDDLNEDGQFLASQHDIDITQILHATLGYYDISLLISTLVQQGFNCHEWRHGIPILTDIPNITGAILHVNDGLGHFVTVKVIDNILFLFDSISQSDVPKRVTSLDEVIEKFHGAVQIWTFDLVTIDCL